MTANWQWLPFDTKTGRHDNSQGYDSFKHLALIRDILSRASGRVFRHTTIVMDFISNKSFNKVVQSASREIIIVLTSSLELKTLPQALENIYCIARKFDNLTV